MFGDVCVCEEEIGMCLCGWLQWDGVIRWCDACWGDLGTRLFEFHDADRSLYKHVSISNHPYLPTYLRRNNI